MKKKHLKAEIAKLQNEVRWAEYRNTNYRNTIAKLTGVPFVFGYNPDDMSMVEGNKRTYGWFQPAVRTTSYVAVEETENEMALRLGFDKFNALLAGQFIDEVK
jgi:hypothetical protein